jgi:death-on-curing protein
MRFLSVDDIVLFHEKIIKETGGSYGIRDIGLIESALNRALMTYGGKDLYPSIIEKIAVVAHSLIANHGFVDGNKRIGVAVMILLLKMNNIKIKYTQQEIVDLGLKVAEGLWKEKDILNWIKRHIEN